LVNISPVSASPLPNQRALFDIPDDIAYLNCAYMSPLLLTSVAAGIEGLQAKAVPWSITPPDFFSTVEKLRAVAASLLNATENDMAIVPSASYGLAVAAKNLIVKPGQHILVLAEQYPSNFYVWKELAAQNGAHLHTVPRPADNDWTGALLNAVNGQTAIAALPHCHWTDGTLVDLAIVRQALDQVGGALVVDLTQSLGALTFDAQVINPDFAVAAGYKWLLGPYSTGLLYIAPQHQQGMPLEFGSFSRLDAVKFSELINYRDEFAPGARRFDVGETANFALVPALLNSLQQILSWEVSRIEATLCRTTNAIAERAKELGLEVVEPPQRAGHFLGLRFPQGLPMNIGEHLARNQVYASVRGDSLRVTPYLYNTERDVDRFLGTLQDILR
jgi:selenocysteine lyase/cysteine desulfurase